MIPRTPKPEREEDDPSLAFLSMFAAFALAWALAFPDFSVWHFALAVLP